MTAPRLSFEFLRSEIVGVDSLVSTPYGNRLLVYCDYTASGRCLRFIEHYLMSLQKHYANTHTEDDVTGRSMTHLLHEAEQTIKNAVNAGEGGRIVAIGTGATAAIDKMQQMIGVAISPAARHQLFALHASRFGAEAHSSFVDYLRTHQPVVFIGPYEHHSNEVTWREGLATVVEVKLSADGCLCLDHLETLLRDPRYENRLRIGSFSAASNVTGMCTPVHGAARLLHRYGAYACVDFAASAPYERIDMNPPPHPDGDGSLDAVFISPHKFLGGPGSSGVLVFNEHMYRRELGPTVGGGGTVDYVGYNSHDFTDDIEEREKAGTPGVLQTLKAALAFEVKRSVTETRIHEREQALVARALERWGKIPNIEILGNPDPRRRVGIVSFNIKTSNGSYLHPKFATTLANDLFGIQSRAGCSCAGPYGHRLLDIDQPTSERYRAWIQKGFHGIKPGWCRIGFHYVMDDAEADFVIEALEFIATQGHCFMPDYTFDAMTGAWTHRRPSPEPEPFSIEAALRSCAPGRTALSADERRPLYREYLEAARAMAAKLEGADDGAGTRLEGEAGELQYFKLPKVCATSSVRDAKG